MLLFNFNYVFSKCVLLKEIKSSGQYSLLRSTTPLTSTGEIGNYEYDENAVTAVGSSWLVMRGIYRDSVGQIHHKMRRIIQEFYDIFILNYSDTGYCIQVMPRVP